MKINCLDKQVGQLLGEAYYKIPRFQRPYSWDHANIEEFWNDAVVESESDYFIGRRTPTRGAVGFSGVNHHFA
jgi:uncharacterized protein with ParB-like and HNH nuclease domain